MNRKKVFLSDGKRGIMNLRFLAAVLCVAAAGWIGASGERETLMRMGNFGGEPVFWVLFMSGTGSRWLSMVAVLVCTLPYTVSFSEEFSSRYYLMSVYRCRWKPYLFSKTFWSGFSGGLAVFLGSMICLLINLGIYGFSVQERIYLSEYLEIYLAVFLIRIFSLFLQGAFWALVGSACSLWMEHSYAAYAAPFILYYILVIFQERYYAGVPFLNPEQWYLQQFIPQGAGIVILIAGILILSIFYQWGMRRRIRDE